MAGDIAGAAFSGQVIRKGDLKYALAATDSFVAEVKPGEIFESRPSSISADISSPGWTTSCTCMM